MRIPIQRKTIACGSSVPDQVRDARCARACFKPSFAGLVVLAGSLYPIPSRTRPLNFPAPMVLSLKTWKSRSLPGLPRTEASSRFSLLAIFLLQRRRGSSPRRLFCCRRQVPAAPEPPRSCRSYRGDAVHLHVERAVPGTDADEAARGRVGGKIARVDRVDRLEMRGVGAIDVALDDAIERRARRRQAEFHLLEHDLGLPLDRHAPDLARRRIVGRDVRDEDEIAGSHGHRDGNLARLGIARQWLDANGMSVHDEVSSGLVAAGSSVATLAAMPRAVARHRFGICRTLVPCRCSRRGGRVSTWSWPRTWSRLQRLWAIRRARPFSPP